MHFACLGMILTQRCTAKNRKVREIQRSGHPRLGFAAARRGFSDSAQRSRERGSVLGLGRLFDLLRLLGFFVFFDHADGFEDLGLKLHG